MIKFNKDIKQFQYFLAFDLAKVKTGWSLIDIKNDKIVKTGLINMSNVKEEEYWFEYAEKVRAVINSTALNEMYIGRTLVTKERCPSQNGKFSSIDALQALAQAHAIFDMVCYEKQLDVYDTLGVHSVSVKAYFKKLTGKDGIKKEDIRDYLVYKYSDYDFSDNLDITDSVAVSLTLFNVKWNNDIKDELKIAKKALKEAKTGNKRVILESRIEGLAKLIIGR